MPSGILFLYMHQNAQRGTKSVVFSMQKPFKYHNGVRIHRKDVHTRQAVERITVPHSSTVIAAWPKKAGTSQRSGGQAQSLLSKAFKRLMMCSFAISADARRALSSVSEYLSAFFSAFSKISSGVL